MGGKQSKERANSPHNTPEPKKKKDKTRLETPAVDGRTHSPSTLQALRQKMKPASPEPRSAEFTKSRIQWPHNRKASPSYGLAPGSSPLTHTDEEPADPAWETLHTNAISSRHSRSAQKLNGGAFKRHSHVDGDAAVGERFGAVEATHSHLRSASTPALNLPTADALGHLHENAPSATLTAAGNTPAPPKKILKDLDRQPVGLENIITSPLGVGPTEQDFDSVQMKRKSEQIFNYPSKMASDRKQRNREAFVYVSDGEDLVMRQGNAKESTVPILDPPAAASGREIASLESGAQSSKPKVTLRRKRNPKRRKSSVMPEMPITDLGPADFELLAQHGMLDVHGKYRKGVAIPYQVLEHVKIYYEEGLCESLRYFLNHVPSCPFLSSAFCSPVQKPTETVKFATTLLDCLCISGRGDDSKDALPSFVPPSSYISMLSTIMIHPQTTTYLANQERAKEASRTAYKCLSNILEAVGPERSNLSTAFRFTAQDSGGRSGRNRNSTRHRRSPGDSDERDDDEEAAIKHKFANKASIGNTADDFWHVAGWAFNCSVNHKERWEYYFEWLRIVMCAMEEDLERCIHAMTDGKTNPLTQSILGRAVVLHYASPSKPIDLRTQYRRALAAIFADGQEQSLRAYPEVWKNELVKELSEEVKNDPKRLFLDEDVPHEKWEKSIQSEQNAKSAKSKRVAHDAEGQKAFGGDAAIQLRCKLLGLMLRLDYYLFDRREASSALYDTICDTLLPLTYNDFVVILANQSYFVPQEAVSSLLQMLVSRLIDTKAPPNPWPSDGFDLPIMIKCFLPWAANTSSPVDNAKLSFCFEQMMRLLPKDRGFEIPREELLNAITAGNEARVTRCSAERVKNKRSPESVKRQKVEDERMREAIDLSGARMWKFLVSLYAVQDGERLQ